MTFIYLITEGVLDVVFLTQVLRHGFGLQAVKRKTDLPGPAAEWLNRFKWPVGDDIGRLAVPAPVFLQGRDAFVGLRNSEGLTNIRRTMDEDQEAFLRSELQPNAVGIVLDADDLPPQQRFAEFAELLAQQGFPRPPALDAIMREGGVRSGVFAFPGRGQAGSLEDVLLPLADARFTDLRSHADAYVQSWCEKDALKRNRDFEELRKPSGPRKATLSSMAALLKPAKPLRASLEDQRWLPNDLGTIAVLNPLIEFLAGLLELTITVAADTKEVG